MRHQLVVVTILLTVTSIAGAENWPRWRGPAGLGHIAGSVPKQWDDSSIVWQTSLPGEGQSSPVVWGERIFLTTSQEEGKRRLVVAIDRSNGKILWQQTAWTGTPETTHQMNHWASATCATDGNYVVAFFGTGGLHCFTVDGKPVWSKDLAEFAGPWGTAASPIIVDGLVIQNCDADNHAYLLAADIKTGQERWRTPRHVIRGWSTPILIEAGGRRELVVNGHLGTNAYDPATGKELWFCKGSSGRGTPSVVYAHGLVYAVNGRSGDTYAVRPGGNGDVTGDHEAWRVRRTGRDLPSPIVVGDYFFVANLRPGTGTCYEAKTGKKLWIERIGECSSSPVAAHGLIYQQNEAGETFVIQPAAEFRKIAQNRISTKNGEIFRASPAPSGDQLLLRSNQRLICIGQSKAGG